MRTLVFLPVCLVFSFSSSFAQTKWTRKADFPQWRYNAVCFNIGDKGYVGAGVGPEGRMNDLWQYDPVSNIWQQKHFLPAPGRESAIGFSINGKGYIGGGVTDTLTRHHDFWEYNPQTDSWTQKGNVPLSNFFQGTLVSFSVNGNGYVELGFNTDNFWEYDPTGDTWTKKARFPGGDLIGHVGFGIGLKGYIGTGFGPSTNTPEFWEYDPSDDQWLRKADFPGTPRNGAVGFSIGGKGYVGLGNASGTFPQDFWTYDPITDTWTKVDSCGYGAEGAFGFTVGSTGYVGTGIFPPVSEVWEYNPSTTGIASLLNFNFFVCQNYPNPFNPSTTIQYALPHRTHVSVAVFNTLGQQVASLVNESQEAGYHEVTFDASRLSSGLYLYRILAGETIVTKKMLLLR